MTSQPVILLELNELTPRLMERFIGAGKLPTFARFYRESRIFTTEADAGVAELEPWIQWITVHSGLGAHEHGVHDLGDGYLVREKQIWDLLSDSGRKVWVCGSMNVQYRAPIRGWILPDPWMTKVSPQPADELLPYFRFVSANVLGHTLDRVPLTAAETFAFAAFMARHGLSGATVAAIARQLAAERLHPNVRWKRTTILDDLQFDLFRWVYQKERPDFSTFFSNSTAHFQHLYWRNLEPERFRVKPDSADQSAYADAILHGYQQMDRLLDRFLRLAGDEATLIFCTAFSQQPFLVYEESGGKRWYRPLHFDRFLRDVGITTPATVAPVMAHQFQADFETEAAAVAAETQMASLRYAGRQAVFVRRTGHQIFAGCQLTEAVEPDAVLTVGESDRSIPFFQVFYRVEGLKSGMHHPEGMLWIRTPERRHSVESAKVPLVAIAPTLLEMFGLPKPDYMKGNAIAPVHKHAA